MQLFWDAIREVECKLEEENISANVESRPRVRPTELRIVGQMSLLLNPKVNSRLRLFATRDVDALILGERSVRTLLKMALKERNFAFDDLSTEIWIPDGATSEVLRTHDLLVCSVLDPISALVSKAVKAKEKNRILIRNALVTFGEELRTKLISHNVDLEYFEKGLRQEL